MQIEIVKSERDVIVHFPKAEMWDDKLCFENDDDWKLALGEGVFFVKIPQEIDMLPGIKFSENFYKEKDGVDDGYKGFNKLAYQDSILGYSDRHDQVEQVQLEIALWEKYFIPELVIMLRKMNHLGLKVIENIFEKVGIEQKYWDVITGEASRGKALQYVIFNHYRPHKGRVGITKHKDSGYITVLYSPEPGLEAYTNERWIPINPEEGYFTINLGHSFEVLTANHTQKIIAVDHRVREIQKAENEADRFSFGTYIGPRFDMNLFQYENRKLIFFETFLEFQKWKAKQMGYEFHPKVKV